MKKLLQLSILFLLTITMTAESCEVGNQLERHETTNEHFKVDLLFEKDSCKIYRFTDQGRDIYWSDCRGKMQYSYTTGGKNKHTEHVENITE